MIKKLFAAAVLLCGHILCGQTITSGILLQTNSSNPQGAIPQPVISSVTGCNSGAQSNTVTYWLSASNSGGSSILSAPVQVNVTSNTAPGCTVNWTPVANVTASNQGSYQVMRDDPSIRACTGAATATSCRDNTQNPVPWGTQTIPIGTVSTIASIGTTGTLPPKINAAGPLVHNFRMDESGQWLTIEIADAYAQFQGAPANANSQFKWNIPTNFLIPAGPLAQSCPVLSYGAPHWTEGFGIEATWIGSTGRAQGVVTTFNSSCAVMAANQYFLNQANGGLDTQSGDLHLSGSSSDPGNTQAIFRDAYPTTNPYNLPSVPYNGEITAWQQPIAISTIARTGGNLVTVTTTGAHNLQSGSNITINKVLDTTFNGIIGTPGVTVTGPSTFTYASTGANISSSGGNVDRPMMRFCHTWADGAEGFNSTPRGGVSQDRKYFLFVSAMMRNAAGSGPVGAPGLGLGSTTGSTSCTPGPSGNCAFALYVCQLK